MRFSGYCWATRINCIEDVNNKGKFKVVLTLIDGDGIQFTATYYGHDRFIENKETPVYIEGVNYIPQTGKKIFYMLSAFTVSKVPLERNMFLREIENLSVAAEDFSNACQNITDAGLRNAINTFIGTTSYMSILKSTTYKDALGTRLGYKLLVSLWLIKTGEIYKEAFKSFDYDSYVAACILMHYKEKVMDGDSARDNVLPIDPKIFTLINELPVDIKKKETLLNILISGEPEVSSPERHVFKHTLIALEMTLKTEENLLQTGQSWQKQVNYYR